MDDNLIKYIEYGSVNISGVILTHLNQLGINATEAVLLIELYYFNFKGDVFPEPQKLADITGFDINLIFDSIHQLVSKKIIAIVDSDTNSAAYSFKPLQQKINQILNNDVSPKKIEIGLNRDHEEESLSERETLFNDFTQEFGRPLSPIELETISDWLTDDHYSTKLVKLALKEAVLKQVYSLKYIDRILIAWKKQNITTAAQVEAQKNQYNQQNQKQSDKQPLPKIPLFKIEKK